MKTAASVTAYIAAQPKPAQAALRKVRAAIRKALPRAEEFLSYQIAAYRTELGAVLFFAGWKKHYSIYPASNRLVETFKKELAPYKVEKATIRFPFSEPVPSRLIGRIAKFRVKESLERADADADAYQRASR